MLAFDGFPVLLRFEAIPASKQCDGSPKGARWSSHTVDIISNVRSDKGVDDIGLNASVLTFLMQ